MLDRVEQDERANYMKYTSKSMGKRQQFKDGHYNRSEGGLDQRIATYQ